MLSGFKTFIMRGNVVDLAVAVIVGAAFTKIVTSLTEDVIMPVIGALIGDADFSRFFILLGDPPATYRGTLTDYAALKTAGVPMLGYGAFITAIVQFLIVAFLIYLLVRAIKRMIQPATEATPVEAAEIALLREIRDELRAGRAAPPSTSH